MQELNNLLAEHTKSDMPPNSQFFSFANINNNLFLFHAPRSYSILVPPCIRPTSDITRLPDFFLRTLNTHEPE